MPTEPLAALVYVFLLVPGIAYSFASEKHRASGKRSAFKETATVVVVSSICVVILLSIILAVSLFLAPVRDWASAFIATPNELVKEHPLGVLGIIIIFLLSASVLGLLLGQKATQNFVRGLLHRDDHIEPDVSGWWKSFELIPEATKRVSVQLKSGRWVSGELRSYNPSPDESQDRSLVLVGRINFRGPGDPREQVLENVQSVVIQASEIDYLGVSYYGSEDAKKLNEI